MLIKPKRIELIHHDEDGERVLHYNIGKYSGLDGLDFIEYSASILKNGLNLSETKIGVLKECMKKMGKYIEYITIKEDGEEIAVSLATESILASAIPSGELAIKLMISVYDYNSFFLKTENLSKQFKSMTDMATELITKTLTQSQAS